MTLRAAALADLAAHPGTRYLFLVAKAAARATGSTVDASVRS